MAWKRSNVPGWFKDQVTGRLKTDRWLTPEQRCQVRRLMAGAVVDDQAVLGVLTDAWRAHTRRANPPEPDPIRQLRAEVRSLTGTPQARKGAALSAKNKALVAQAREALQAARDAHGVIGDVHDTAQAALDALDAAGARSVGPQWLLRGHDEPYLEAYCPTLRAELRRQSVALAAGLEMTTTTGMATAVDLALRDLRRTDPGAHRWRMDRLVAAMDADLAVRARLDRTAERLRQVAEGR